MKKEIEIWKKIKDLEGFYEISNLGNVKSISRVVNSSVQKCGFRIIKEKIKQSQDNGKGYKQLYVQVNNKRKLFYIHRLVAQSFLPNPENKPQVNHINGIKTDNRVQNLEWCTSNENRKHAVDNNLMKKGENHSKSKLTEKDILAIRRLYRINPRFNKTNIAKKLGVRDTTIHKIINNQRWKHI